MSKNRLTEKELLEGLDAHTAHADDLARPLLQELTALERLKCSAKRHERPTKPVWVDWFDSEDGVSTDFMEDQTNLGTMTTIRNSTIPRFKQRPRSC